MQPNAQRDAGRVLALVGVRRVFALVVRRVFAFVVRRVFALVGVGRVFALVGVGLRWGRVVVLGRVAQECGALGARRGAKRDAHDARPEGYLGGSCSCPCRHAVT